MFLLENTSITLTELDAMDYIRKMEYYFYLKLKKRKEKGFLFPQEGPLKNREKKGDTLEFPPYLSTLTSNEAIREMLELQIEQKRLKERGHL